LPLPEKMSLTYAETYAQSLADPDAFWLRAAAALDWAVPPRQGPT